MIIIHNPADKQSRDFVEQYGEGCDIIEYADGFALYPNVSAFPSIPIFVPEYSIRIKEADQEITIQVPEHEELYRCPATLQEVLDYIAMVEARAVNS